MSEANFEAIFLNMFHAEKKNVSSVFLTAVRLPSGGLPLKTAGLIIGSKTRTTGQGTKDRWSLVCVRLGLSLVAGYH